MKTYEVMAFFPRMVQKINILAKKFGQNKGANPTYKDSVIIPPLFLKHLSRFLRHMIFLHAEYDKEKPSP